MIELTLQINLQVQEDASSRSGFLQRVWKQLRQSLGGLTGLRQLRDFAEV